MDQNNPAGHAPAEPNAPAAAGVPAALEPPTAPPAPSGGALLKAARERQGVHIAALAAAIKVSPRKLEALEADRWHELTDATFTRALAQAVCRSLKIDSKPVLELLPAGGPAPLEPPGTRLNTQLRDRNSRHDPAWRSSAMRPWLLGAGALVIGAVAVMVLPASWWQLGGARTLAASAATSAAAPASAPAALAPVEPASAALATEAAAAASAPAHAASGTAPGEPMAAAQMVPAALAGSAPTRAAADVFDGAVGLLQLYAARDAWVGVRDAQGNQIVSRRLVAGERLVLDGQPPLKLTVGNAADVEVRFRGEPVSLVPHIRDNVARLDLQ